MSYISVAVNIILLWKKTRLLDLAAQTVRFAWVNIRDAMVGQIPFQDLCDLVCSKHTHANNQSACLFKCAKSKTALSVLL